MQSKLFQLVLFILIPFVGFAQSENLDYVYLKNGSLFKGEIVEYQDGGQLHLKLDNERTFIFEDKNIKRIVQGGTYKIHKDKSFKPYNFKEKGMYYFFAGNINGGSSAFQNEGTAGLGIQAAAGYQLNRWLGAGLGIGMDYYYPGSGERFMPVFAEVRGYLRQKNVAPYYSVQTGYGFTFVDEDRAMEDSQGGIYLYPALGLRCGASDNANFTIDIGYKYQKGTFAFRQWDLVEHKMTYRRIALRVGVLF